jgi:FKBP-type peptidyl-prolyl cis-trans isomerase SlpA
MEVGEKKTVEIDVDMAYGQYNEAMIQEVPKEQVPEGVVVGSMLQANTPMGPINFRVLEVNETNVKLDGNHPLAGKKLIFDLEVLEVN